MIIKVCSNSIRALTLFRTTSKLEGTAALAATWMYKPPLYYNQIIILPLLKIITIIIVQTPIIIITSNNKIDWQLTRVIKITIVWNRICLGLGLRLIRYFRKTTLRMCLIPRTLVLEMLVHKILVLIDSIIKVQVNTQIFNQIKANNNN